MKNSFFIKDRQNNKLHVHMMKLLITIIYCSLVEGIYDWLISKETPIFTFTFLFLTCQICHIYLSKTMIYI